MKDPYSVFVIKPCIDRCEAPPMGISLIKPWWSIFHGRKTPKAKPNKRNKRIKK